MNKVKVQELKFITAVYEMSCQSLSPGEFEKLMDCLDTLCKRRNIKTNMFDYNLDYSKGE